MTRFFLLVFLICGVLPNLNAADPSTATVDLTGRYVREHRKDGRRFELVVRQYGSQASARFSASLEGAQDASLEGNGSGSVSADGVFTFKFGDSSGNRGVATLKRRGDAFRLSIRLTKVTDSSRSVHYGELRLLKKPMKD